MWSYSSLFSIAPADVEWPITARSMTEIDLGKYHGLIESHNDLMDGASKSVSLLQCNLVLTYMQTPPSIDDRRSLRNNT